MDFKPLVTLLAIVNPMAIVPFFIHYTQNFDDRQRRRTILVSAFSCFMVIAVSALMGLHILDFWHLTGEFSRSAAASLLLTSSLAMLNAQPAEARSMPRKCKTRRPAPALPWCP